MTQQTNSDFDSTNLLVFLYKWRRPIILTTIAAAVISAVVSLLIPNKYQSTVIFFPANTSSISKATMTEDVTGKNDIVSFGEEEQAEQMLQILNSDEIRWNIIGKYDLMKHYDIDTSDEYKLTKLYQEFDDNVTFKRTEFLSIRIDVLDKSPDTAALIANDIARLVDVAKNRMQKERAMEALKVIEQEYNEFKSHMQRVDDSLKLLASKGVLDVEKQTEMLSTQYYKAIAEGNRTAEKRLQEKLDTLAKYASAFVSLTDNGEYERERLLLLQSKYEEIKVDANSDVPHKFTVNKAYPAEKKAYPVRWLIVVVSTISGFLLSVLAVIAVENFRRLKASDIK